MSKKNAKIEKILDIAFELLKHEGDFGVSMRKIATLADMSLSNVQYYFKNKDALLKVMADRYFQQCLEELNELAPIQTQDELESFVAAVLEHGHEISDMCRIFREYWAISTRNEAIDDYLMHYYQALTVSVSNILKPLATDETNLKIAVSILIPYVEGYSVTARAMPADRKMMIQTITALLFAQLTAV